MMITGFGNAMRALSLQRPEAGDSIVTRAQRGETAAIGELYDMHHQAVRAFAQRLVGDEAIAEDLVHEVFIALPKALKRFRGESSLRSFLKGVAVNHARHFIRGAARRRAAQQRLAEEPRSESAPSPERENERKHLRSALNSALDGLPVDQRVAFVLCDVEGNTSAETAAMVNAPEATVRTRLFHARKKLRATLEQRGFR